MKAKKNISQEEWNALARKAFGNLSAEEEKTLKNELKSYDSADFEEIEKTAEQINLYYKLKIFNSKHAFGLVKPRIETKKRSFVFAKTSNLLRIAAVVVLALMVGSVWYFSEDMKSEIETPILAEQDYGITNVVLPDGTFVTLNRDSKINYPDEFTSDKREVYIEGEAFFDVVPNPEKPFIIHAGDANIKVLGTSFNVNAYPGNERVEVVVSTGKVQFYSEEINQIPGKELILDPGDKGIFVNASKELLKMQNHDPNFIAWKTRHLIFSETKLNEVIEQLSKLYNIQIKTIEPGLNELKYTGHFENHSIDFILEVISLTFDIEVNEENECYFLNKKS